MTTESCCKEIETESAACERKVEPFADVYQDEHGVRLLLDLPGVSEDVLDVDVNDGVLRIRGQAERGSDEIRVYERGFRLGRRIDTAAIDASLKQGVLELKLPYREEAKPRKIQIKVG